MESRGRGCTAGPKPRARESPAAVLTTPVSPPPCQGLRRRAATVTARVDSVVWAVDRVTFRRIVMNNTFRKRKMYEAFIQTVPILQSLDVRAAVPGSLIDAAASASLTRDRRGAAPSAETRGVPSQASEIVKVADACEPVRFDDEEVISMRMPVALSP